MSSTRQKKIFIFIRDELVSKALTFALTDNFFDVSAFNTQTELIDNIALHKPDLILFDYRLKNSEEEKTITNFFIQLKTRFIEIPIILMYAPYMSAMVKPIFNKAHPDAILKKPFKLMELLDKANKVLYSGRLEHYPFPILIQTFYEEKRTGVLHITVEETKYFVYFIEGRIVYIEYGLRKDTLGMLLLKQGKITEDQYNNSLSDASKNNTRLGGSLIKLGYLTPAELNNALENQVNEKIVNCFAEKEGMFTFKFLDRFVDDIVIYKKKTQKIIFEGVKRHYDLERLDTFYKMIKTRKFKISDSMVYELDVYKFNTNELKIVSKLKNMCTYDELALDPEIDKLLLVQILYTLLVTRYLVIADKKETLKEEEVIKKKKTVEPEKTETTKESEELKNIVYETYLKIKSLNYYDILEIQRDASPEMIKSAYTKKAKQFHPDRFIKEKQPDIIQKATEIFSKLSNAFKILTDDTMKKEYDYKLDHPKEAELLSNANEIIQSEMEFLKGEKLLNNRDFSAAEHSFDVAMQMNPKEPEYKCYYAWAHFLNPKNDKGKKVKLAKKLINEALGVNAENDMAYHFLGSIARFEGDLGLAKKHFKKALEINPGNKNANAMLNAIQKDKK